MTEQGSLTLPVTTFPVTSRINLLDDYQERVFSTLSSILVCWAQLTINSHSKSEVRGHIRTEPPTPCREHFLWQSACRSQWEVSHQRSKVRKGVWIKLISFSCTDSKDCRLSLWKLFDFHPSDLVHDFHVAVNRSVAKPFSTATLNTCRQLSICGQSALWEQNHWGASAHVNVCCSQLVPTRENLTHLSPTYLLAVIGSMGT